MNYGDGVEIRPLSHSTTFFDADSDLQALAKVFDSNQDGVVANNPRFHLIA